MNSEFLTTGQAAKVCLVTPDTVLKWIRSGRLPAHRTPGGHHRIKRVDLEALVHQNGAAEDLADESQWSPSPRPSTVRYCWEYNSHDRLLDACRNCIGYRMRAHRCYEVIKLVPKGRHAEQFCHGNCSECGYYQQVHQQSTNVLVITDNASLSEALIQEAHTAPYTLKVTSCEYTASAVVQDFRPDYVVVDCSLRQQESRDISTHLLADPRIPYVRVIMATDDGRLPAGCDKQIFAHIVKPLHADDITRCVNGSGEAGGSYRD